MITIKVAVLNIDLKTVSCVKDPHDHLKQRWRPPLNRKLRKAGTDVWKLVKEMNLRDKPLRHASVYTHSVNEGILFNMVATIQDG